VPGFVRDESDWLRRLAPDEWIRAALGDLERAKAAFARGDVRGGIAGCKRAAGMALNGALIVEPCDGWGRTYVEHLAALAKDAVAPEAVRAACAKVLDARPPSGAIVALRTPSAHAGVVDAARDVIAHAWAIVKGYEGNA
jgi:hypothetical protein